MTEHPATLEARELEVRYGEQPIIRGIDLVLPANSFTVIIGPNASGKSTLLTTMARVLRPRSGAVLLDRMSIHDLPTKRVARSLGLLPQSATAPESVTVRDLVGRGRHPHQSFLRQWSAEDDAAVAEALELTAIRDLADRPVDELSGGQRQRVWLAMVIAQRVSHLLLDEPTTFLDLTHQLDVLDLCADLRDRGVNVVAVLHDLNLACRYADHLVVLSEGRVVGAGRPSEVVDARMLNDVFGLSALVIDDPETGTPMIVPSRRRSNAAQRGLGPQST